MKLSKNYSWLQASSLAESVIATVIISICVLIATMVFVNAFQTSYSTPYLEGTQKVFTIIEQLKEERLSSASGQVARPQHETG